MTKKVTTEIIIKAKPEKIWQILMDFSKYPSWNPFIQKLVGKAELGAVLKARICPPNGGKMTFSPKIVALQENEIFIWKGKLFLPGIFDGEHRFILEKKKNEVRFVQEEFFTGFLVKLLPKSIYEKTKNGFELMNEALKKEAEKK